LLWYRSKDIEDIKGILARQDKLDWNYIENWTKGLELKSKLESILERPEE